MLAQIKFARKEAMRRRNERRREQRASTKASEATASGGASDTAADTATTASGSPSSPLEAKSESGGVTITRVAATCARKAQAAIQPPTTSVEEVAPQEEQLSASFLQLAAERGHKGELSLFTCKAITCIFVLNVAPASQFVHLQNARQLQLFFFLC